MNLLSRILLMFSLAIPAFSAANPLLDPGDTLLRHDLELLNDSGVINVPLTAWPLSTDDIDRSLRSTDQGALSPLLQAAFERVFDRMRAETDTGEVLFAWDASASLDPRFIRTFEHTPRDEGEVGASLMWTGERFTVRLSASGVVNPFDGDEFRPDGSYVGVALGNWILTAGWQDRWWGPSRDGSLILSSNARSTPGIMLQRNSSRGFKNKWLSWMGPWTLSTFMTELDDSRVVPGARLFGVRGSFRPPKTGLEIGVSRVAQWCGDNRPCSWRTFADLLVGNDNSGVNVGADDEPGNQLGGFDIRWRLPRNVPAALYMQWIGEDGRGGGGAIGSWLRQLGAEHWGRLGSLQHRTHVEVSDTTCRQGGFGFSDKVPVCAYVHSIYQTGFRYQGRSIAHGTDGDSLSYSIGSTLVQSTGHTWNISIRHMDINREGRNQPGHTLSATPVEVSDLQITYSRYSSFGRFRIGLSVSQLDDPLASNGSTDFGGFLQWSSR